MTHVATKKRNRELVAELRKTLDAHVIASRYDMSVMRVMQLARENKVDLPRYNHITDHFVVLNRLLNGESPHKIAGSYGVTDSCIVAIRGKAMKAGFVFAVDAPEFVAPTLKAALAANL